MSRHRSALFLDIDGTLIDIAATPQSVIVPDALPALLYGLSSRLDGALALVSGRPVAQIDALMAPLALPCAGGHGAQLRLVAGGPLTDIDEHKGGSGDGRFELPIELVSALASLAAHDARLLLEHKPHSMAIHFRAAPELAGPLRDKLDQLLLRHPQVEILAGKMIYELKRPGFDKGRAIVRLMRDSPFDSRLPVMIGDDITDEAAFAAVLRLGGEFFSVGRDLPGAAGIFDDPRAVRLALADVLGRAISTH